MITKPYYAAFRKIQCAKYRTNQTIAQIDLWLNAQGKPTQSGVTYENGKVYVHPNKLGEKVE